MPDRPSDDARVLVGRLYDSYGASLYRYAVMLLANPATAEDAVQEVFTAVLRRRGRIDNEAHYLRRAVRNKCYSMLRRERTQSEATLEQLMIEPMIDGGVAYPEQIALDHAMRELPPEQREVIHLHVFEGLTFQEIADASETSINTIAARYRYALAKLRQILA